LSCSSISHGPARAMVGQSRVTPKPASAILLRTVLYALVPILTLGVEDSFLVKELGYVPMFGQYPLPRSGVTMADLASLAVLGLALPYVFDRRNRPDLKAFSVLAFAVLVSGIYGLLQGTDPKYRLFEPSAWKTLVPLFALTVAFNHCLSEDRERQRFLSWFCAVQFVFAGFLVLVYLGSGIGQPTYFGARVPIFAGPALTLLTIAYAISLFRLVSKFSWLQVAYVAVFAITIMLSLRRSFIAWVFSAPAFYFALTPIMGQRSRKWLYQAARLMVVVLLVALAFFAYVGPMRLTPTLIAGRFRSLNLFWAHEQANPYFGPVGHTADFLDGLEIVVNNPIFGKGLGVWFYLPRSGDWQESQIHAGIFQIWIKLGILGVIGYLWLFGKGLRLLRDIRTLDHLTGERLFLVWFSVNFILCSIYRGSILFGYKQSFVTAMFLGTCTSLMLARSRYAPRRPIPPPLRASGGSSVVPRNPSEPHAPEKGSE